MTTHVQRLMNEFALNWRWPFLTMTNRVLADYSSCHIFLQEMGSALQGIRFSIKKIPTRHPSFLMNDSLIPWFLSSRNPTPTL